MKTKTQKSTLIKSIVLIFSLFLLTTTYAQENELTEINKLLKEGFELFENESNNLAEEKFRRVLKIESENKNALYGIMLCYMDEKKYSELISEFSEYEDLFTDKKYKVRYFFNISVAYFFTNETDQGYTYLKKYENLVDSESLLPADFLMFSKVFYHYNEHELALEYLNDFYEFDKPAKNDIEIALYHTKVLYEMGNHQEAFNKIDELLETLNSQQEKISSLSYFSTYLVENNDYKGAKPYAEMLLSDAYKNEISGEVKANSQYILALYFLSAKENKEALQLFKEINPQHLDKDTKARFYRLILFEVLEKDPPVFEDYIKLAKNDFPDEFFFQALHGIYHSQNGNRSKAEELYINSLHKNTIGDFYDHHKIIANIFMFFHTNSKYEPDFLFKKASMSEEINTSHIFSLAQAAFKADEIEQSKKYFTLAVDRFENNPRSQAIIRFTESVFRINKMDLNEAISSIEKAYEYDPQNFYLMAKSYYQLIGQFFDDKLERKSFKSLLKNANKTEDGPREFVGFLTALAHYNLDEQEEACEIARIISAPLSKLDVTTEFFCKDNTAVKKQFEESFKLISMLMINYSPED